ncbi:psbQ-like protein 3, chloroplastic [Rosa sericea]
MRAAILQNNLMHFNPTFSCCLKPSFQFREMRLKDFDININRRRGAIAALSLVLLAKDSISTKLAYGFDFQLVAPDQTIEEAESGIIGHAQALLQVKELIESESWGQVQTAVRKSSPFLKQDIYTIIQQKPGNERPLLRKLYSNLFNNVTRLDYAARDRDASRIRECYENIVMVLNEVLSRL